MKRVLLSLTLLFLFSAVKAQKVYFIYLQSESNAPFFIKMAGQVYSSSASGYLILSNLKDSTYKISLGFPSSKEEELRFALNVSHTDKGYLLKKFEAGYALFDLQDLTIIKPVQEVSNGTSQKTIKREDAFTKLLAQAADDESLLTEVVYEEKKEPIRAVKDNSVKDVAVQPAVNKEEKITDAATKDIVQAVNSDQLKAETKQITPDSTIATTTGELNDQKVLKEVKEDEIAKDEQIIPAKQDQKAADTTVVSTQTIGEQKPTAEIITKQEDSQHQEKKDEAPLAEPLSEYKKSLVTRRAESSTTEGFGLVFLDNMDGVTDTIRLLIPNPKIQFVNQSSEPTEEETLKAVEEKTAIKQEPAREEKKTEETTETKNENSIKEEANDKSDKPLFGFRKKDKTNSEQLTTNEKDNESKKEKPLISFKKKDVDNSEQPTKEADEESKKEKPLISFKKKDKDQVEAPSVVTESRLADVQPDGSRPSGNDTNNKVSCRSTASENDFFKLRKNMASESDEESMIDAARKFFRSKCFSTEQVKNLGALFLTEENKYNFYDLSYKYVHDREQFRSLEGELKEDYYIRRFKALIGE